MMRKVACFLATIIVVPVLYIFAIIGIGISGLLWPIKRARLFFVDFYYKWWNRILIASTMSGITIEGEGNIPDGAVVYFANHNSYVDISVMSAYIDWHASFMAKRSLLWFFPIGYWVLAGEGVLVERKGTRRELEAILLIIDKVRKGRSFIIFPEGTRSRTGELGEIKAGSLKIPQKARVPIIPVRIRGTREILSRDDRWFSPGKIEVEIGEPISPIEIDENKEEVLKRLRSHLSGHLITKEVYGQDIS